MSGHVCGDSERRTSDQQNISGQMSTSLQSQSTSSTTTQSSFAEEMSEGRESFDRTFISNQLFPDAESLLSLGSTANMSSITGNGAISSSPQAMSPKSTKISFEDERMNQSGTMESLVLTKGYRLETYEVITNDGYILQLFRILPHPQTNTSAGQMRAEGGRHISIVKKRIEELNGPEVREKKPAVLLQHGFMSSATVWVLGDDSNSLAFALVEKGFDVWLANSRGTKFCEKHTHFDSNAAEFWQFSFHEMGVFDLPATIDFILNKTGERRLDYVGMSLGTTIFFVCMAKLPEYNSKVRRMIAMAPVVFCNNMTSPIRFLNLMNGVIHYVTAAEKFAMLNQFRNRGRLDSIIGTGLCRIKGICSSLASYLEGGSPDMYDQEMMGMFIKHMNEGSSARTFGHVMQMQSTDRFAPWDYGNETLNVISYGANPPPEYDLGRIKTKVYTFWSEQDKFSNEEDIEKLHRQLPNLRESHRITSPHFGHLHFIMGKDVVDVIFRPVIEILQRRKPKKLQVGGSFRSSSATLDSKDISDRFR